jgi:hypothetical protein
MAIFALNRKYPLNDKTALAETGQFEIAPREFGPRVQAALERLSPAGIGAAVASVAELVRETVELAGGLYRPQFTPPK